MFVYDVIFSASSKFLLATIIIVDLVDNNVVFLSGSDSAGFSSFVDICFAFGDPIIEKVRVGIPLTDLTPPQLYVCPKPENEFPM